MLKIALNQNTCKELDLIEFIKFSKDFHGIEINYEKIKKALSNKINIQEIIELLDVYDLLTVSIFNLEDFSLCSDKYYKLNIIPSLHLMIDHLYKLESNLLVVSASLFKESQDPKTIPKWRIINKTRKRLLHISKIASKNDINIGFEFLNSPKSSISTFSDAKEVMDDLEAIDNLGYVIDVFHFFKSNENFKRINDIREKIFLIQLSDVKFTDKEELDSIEDKDRTIPGEGDFELKEFINFTSKIGYRSMYSIELSEKCCMENIYDAIMKNLKNLI
ncbi:MAG: sugar phosphate isomerase/epimerase family protein [Promethearchaeota archaeon]